MERIRKIVVTILVDTNKTTHNAELEISGDETVDEFKARVAALIDAFTGNDE